MSRHGAQTLATSRGRGPRRGCERCGGRRGEASAAAGDRWGAEGVPLRMNAVFRREKSLSSGEPGRVDARRVELVSRHGAQTLTTSRARGPRRGCQRWAGGRELPRGGAMLSRHEGAMAGSRSCVPSGWRGRPPGIARGSGGPRAWLRAGRQRGRKKARFAWVDEAVATRGRYGGLAIVRSLGVDRPSPGNCTRGWRGGGGPKKRRTRARPSSRQSW